MYALRISCIVQRITFSEVNLEVLRSAGTASLSPAVGLHEVLLVSSCPAEALSTRAWTAVESGVVGVDCSLPAVLFRSGFFNHCLQMRQGNRR